MEKKYLEKFKRPKGTAETLFEVLDTDLMTQQDCTARDASGKSLHTYKTLEEAVKVWSELNLREPGRLHKVMEQLPDGSKKEVETPELSEALIRVRSQMTTVKDPT